MSDLLVVSTDRVLTGDDSARMLEAKIATLGYGKTTIQTPSGFNAQSTTGPLGGVTCENDARRLIAALEIVFQRTHFATERQNHPDAHFVFHAP
jgi:hypothetical protein